ncbi:MAG: arginine repressor [Acidimicrobiia bacterium]|nr:arginine repressor [Acidimicrobiia bacterium]
MRADTLTRRRTIRSMLASTTIQTQAEIKRHLAERGFNVTQATISRDLDAVGAVRVKADGQSVYRLGEVSDDDDSRVALHAAFDEFVESIAISGNLIILKVPPGAAHLVASRVDGAAIDGVLGSVAGDDTILVIADEIVGAEKVSARLEGTNGR